MFTNITTAAEGNKIGTTIVGLSIAGGIVFGIAKKKGFWSTFGFAIGFGLAGLAVSTVVGQLTTTN